MTEIWKILKRKKQEQKIANLWFSAHQVLFTIIKISVRQSWVKTEKVGRPREISRFCNIYMGYSGGFEAAVRSAKFSRCPPPHGVCKYQLIFLLEVSILIFLRISISDFWPDLRVAASNDKIFIVTIVWLKK